MIGIRKGKDRGYADRGWLEAHYTFSFADYFDPQFMGFRVLRVLNDDRIGPGRGFGPHGHRDMEILTYVLEGSLLHRDSTGQRHILNPNEVQAMSAGNGIVHSEFNASETQPSRSIQIWITPKAEDLTASYQQVAFDPAEKRGRLRLLAGPKADANKAATTINQDARLYVAELRAGETIRHAPTSGRYAWLQIVNGEILLNDTTLEDGDGAAITGETDLQFTGSGKNGGEFLFFDLP